MTTETSELKYETAPDTFHKRNFKKLMEMSGHKSRFEDGATIADIQELCEIDEREAWGTIRWAMFYGLFESRHNEYEPDTLYFFSQYGIRSGMTIEVDPDQLDESIPRFGVKNADFLWGMLRDGSYIRLDHKHGQGSNVLPDGRVMIKGVGYFPQAYFREHKPEKPELYLLRDVEGGTLLAHWKTNGWILADDSQLHGPSLSDIAEVIGRVVPCEDPSARFR